MTKRKKTANYIGALVVVGLPAFYMWLSPKIAFSVPWLFAFVFLAALIAFADVLKRAWDGLAVSIGKDGWKFEDRK
jgi:hypothetical protein